MRSETTAPDPFAAPYLSFYRRLYSPDTGPSTTARPSTRQPDFFEDVEVGEHLYPRTNDNLDLDKVGLGEFSVKRTSPAYPFRHNRCSAVQRLSPSPGCHSL